MIHYLRIFFSYLRYEFAGRAKNIIVFSGYDNVKYNFNSKYLFEYFLLEAPQYKVYFIINNDALRAELNTRVGPFFITTKNFSHLRIIFKAFTWITSGGLPIRIPYANRHRVVVNLWHGLPFKGIGLMNGENNFVQNILIRFIYSRYDFISATSELFQQIMSRSFAVSIERVKILGQAWNDQLWNRQDKVEFLQRTYDLPFDVSSEDRLVLYAPTWRASTSTRFFPFPDFSLESFQHFLEENRIVLCLRTHQLDSNHVEKYRSCPRILLLNEDKIADIMSVLNNFDALISDYSGIIFDFLLLDRPIILLPYDKEEYVLTRRVNMDFSVLESVPSPQTMADFMLLLSEIGKNKITPKQQRLKAVCHLWLDNQSCKRHMDAITELINRKYRN